LLRTIAQYFSYSLLAMLLGSITTALLAILAFPPFNYWYCGWVAFVPLLTVSAQANTTSFGKGPHFIAGLLAGILFFYGTCYWLSYSMIHYGGIPSLLAYFLVLVPVIISALFWATFALLVYDTVQHQGKHALLLTPIFWTASEYLRLCVTDVGWNLLGYSQAFQPRLLGPAAYGGVFLIGSLLLATSTAIAYFITSYRAKQIRWQSVAVLIVGLMLPVTISLPATPDDPITTVNAITNAATPNSGVIKEKVAIAGDDHSAPAAQTPLAASPHSATLNTTWIIYAVQGNAPVDASEEQLSRSFRQQLQATINTVQAARQIPTEGKSGKDSAATAQVLVIWPEASYRLAYERDPQLPQILGDFARQHNIYWLLNAETGSLGHTYNSIIAISPQGSLAGRYQKVHLLPFGEYIPGRSWLPFADQITAVAGDFAAAKDYQLLSLSNLNIGGSICFEAAFPQVNRTLTRRGAQLLVNVANDGWFGPTAIGQQHLAHNVLRAVENHRPLVRVANSGITAYITATGRIVNPTALFEPAVRGWALTLALANQNPTNQGQTFYTQYGDLWAQGCVLISLLVWGARHWRRGQPHLAIPGNFSS
jgi:apolipoprotein N-acyltransferase